MTVEVATGCRLDPTKGNTLVIVDNDGEPARPAREHDEVRASWVERHGMAALGQRQTEVGMARLVESSHMVLVQGIRPTTDEQRPGIATNTRSLKP